MLTRNNSEILLTINIFNQSIINNLTHLYDHGSQKAKPFLPNSLRVLISFTDT